MMKDNNVNKTLIYFIFVIFTASIVYFYYSINKQNHMIIELKKENSVLTEHISDLTNSIANIVIDSTLHQPTAAQGTHYKYSSFFIDPVNGNPSNDGSFEHPWQNINDVITSGYIEYTDRGSYNYNSRENTIVNEGAPVKSGDMIFLMSGNHGSIKLDGINNDIPITIAIYPKERVFFDSIRYDSWNNWILENFSERHYEVIHMIEDYSGS